MSYVERIYRQVRGFFPSEGLHRVAQYLNSCRKNRTLPRHIQVNNFPLISTPDSLVTRIFVWGGWPFENKKINSVNRRTLVTLRECIFYFEGGQF